MRWWNAHLSMRLALRRPVHYLRTETRQRFDVANDVWLDEATLEDFSSAEWMELQTLKQSTQFVDGMSERSAGDTPTIRRRYSTTHLSRF